MKKTYYCTDQQIKDWEYRTLRRYEFAVPEVYGINVFLKKLTYKATFNTFGKTEKIQKKALTWENTARTLKDRNVFSVNTLTNEAVPLAQKKNPSPRTGARTCKHNPVESWRHISNITLHLSSGKLLSRIELYPSFYMALCCFGNQGPQIIRSKRAVAGFSLVKGAIIGTRSHLQKQNKYYFLYKWAFIGAGVSPTEHSARLYPKIKSYGPESRYTPPKKNQRAECLGVNNVFIFPELDKYSYNLFEPIGGFDLTFNIQNEKSATSI